MIHFSSVATPTTLHADKKAAALDGVNLLVLASRIGIGGTGG